MNTNTYTGLMTKAIRDLKVGERFIYNYMGGVRTIYTADSVRGGFGEPCVVSYHIEDADGFKPVRSEFYTAGLSTIVKIDSGSISLTRKR